MREAGFPLPTPPPCRTCCGRNQLDERLIHIGRQKADELLPGRRVLVAQQHVRDFMQGDVGGVEGGGPGLVVDVVGIRGADPQPARTPRPGAERAQPDRAIPLSLEPSHELAQLRDDLQRFVFLLGGSDDEALFGPDTAR
jgi:hypothetical protein